MQTFMKTYDLSRTYPSSPGWYWGRGANGIDVPFQYQPNNGRPIVFSPVINRWVDLGASGQAILIGPLPLPYREPIEL
jgi:hypothetical protein